MKNLKPRHVIIGLILLSLISFTAKIFTNPTLRYYNLSDKAAIALRNGNKLLAEDYYIRALSEAKKTKLENANVANTYESLATLYKDKTLFAEAESLYKQAIDIKTKTLGTENLSTAHSIQGLGMVYLQKCESQKAEAELNRAQSIYEHLSRQNDSHFIGNYIGLSAVYYFNKDYEKAIKMVKKAYTLSKASNSISQYKITLIEELLACYYIDLKKYDKAKILLDQVVESLRVLNMSESPEMAYVFKSWGRINFKQGNIQKAERLYLKAFALFNKPNNINSDYIPDLYIEFGELYSYKKQYSKAINYYNKALDIRKQKYASSCSFMQETRSKLSALQKAQHKSTTP